MTHDLRADAERILRDQTLCTKEGYDDAAVRLARHVLAETDETEIDEAFSDSITEMDGEIGGFVIGCPEIRLAKGDDGYCVEMWKDEDDVDDDGEPTVSANIMEIAAVRTRGDFVRLLRALHLETTDASH